MVVEEPVRPVRVGAEQVGEGLAHGAPDPGFRLREAPRLPRQVAESQLQGFVDDVPARDEGVVPVEDDGAGGRHRFAHSPRQ